MNGLEIANISKRFNDTTAVDAVSLSIRSGELFFLLGPSGCGKTTLLRIIAGFTAPDGGSITFGESDLLKVPVEKRNIGMVFQNYSLWPHMSVFDNVAYGLRMRKTGSGDIRMRVDAALDMVEMTGLAARKPGALSGGQQQRVALARALVYEPKLLLLDEPLSNLDAKLRKDMRSGIRRLHERLGITMVYVTHDQEEAASMADRVALMHKGAVLQIGSPKELYRFPESRFAAEFFGRANILTGTVAIVTGNEVGLKCGDRTIFAELPHGKKIEQGMKVDAVIRPENMAFAAGSNYRNTLTGRLVNQEFLGAVTNSIVDMDGMQLTVMTVTGDMVNSLGDQVSLTFKPADIHLVIN
jgi:ABC-type Fe3+/spermidine/putrescine transport system ATPase subunit